MRKVLSRNPDVVLMLIAGYFLCAVLARVIRSPGLEVDESQQAVLSQFLLLGYGSQPPVYSWLQYGVNAILSPSIASLSVLKNGLLFLCCLFFWLTARLLIREKALVNMATLGVLTLPTVFVMSQRDLTHTVLALFAVSLFVYVLFGTLKKPSALGYILTGLVIGLGAVSKYNFVIIPLAAVLALALEEGLRNRLLDWRLLLTAAAALIVVAPHFLWVVDHLDLATGQTTNEMREGGEHAIFHGLSGMLALILAFAQGLALTTAIFAVLFFKDIKAILRASDQSTRIIGRIMLFSFLFLLLIVLWMSATHVRQKWVSVYLLLWPLYLCLKVQAAGVMGERRLHAMLTVTSVLAVGFVLVLLGRGLVAPYLDRYSLVHRPYHSFAGLLRNDGHMEPQYIMAVGGIVGGNLKMQFPNSTVFIGDRDVEPLPTSWPAGSVVLLAGDSKEAEMQQDPADVLAELAERTSLPIPSEVTRIDVPYATASEKRHTFYYAWETIPLR